MCSSDLIAAVVEPVISVLFLNHFKVPLLHPFAEIVAVSVPQSEFLSTVTTGLAGLSPVASTVTFVLLSDSPHVLLQVAV